MVLYNVGVGWFFAPPPVLGAGSMTLRCPNVRCSRLSFTLTFAALAAGLMLLVAWLKSTTAPGTLFNGLLEGAILVLAVGALFIPYLAMRSLGESGGRGGNER
jgi:hypothetical protein